MKDANSGRILAFVAVALLGAAAGGAGVWYLTDPPAAGVAPAEPTAEAAEPAPTRVITRVVVEDSDEEDAYLEEDDREPEIVVVDPRDYEEETQPTPAQVRAYHRRRVRTAGLDAIAVADDVLAAPGTPGRVEARIEMNTRYRSALDDAPPQVKRALTRFYQATQSRHLPDGATELEWEEAREDLLDALDTLE